MKQLKLFAIAFVVVFACAAFLPVSSFMMRPAQASDTASKNAETAESLYLFGLACEQGNGVHMDFVKAAHFYTQEAEKTL